MDTYSFVQAVLNGMIWVCYAAPFVFFALYMIDVLTREDLVDRASNRKQESSLGAIREDSEGTPNANQTASSHVVPVNQADHEGFSQEIRQTLDFSKMDDVRRVQSKGTPIILSVALEGGGFDLSGIQEVIHPLGRGYRLADLEARFVLVNLPHPSARERKLVQSRQSSKGFQRK